MKDMGARLIEGTENRPVLLTGSSGYIGSRLATQLRLSRIDYIGVDKASSNRPNDECFNLRDEKLTRDAVRTLSPACIIHTGTHSALAYQNDFLASFHEDAHALTNLLGALRGRTDTRLIVFSSSYVYSGLASGRAVTENTVLNAAHNFGLAKSFFEQLILRNHPNSVLFRLSSVFGRGTQAHPNAIADMAGECLAHNRVTVWGTGQRKIQYIYIDDVIKYTFEALSLPSGIYNLGGREYTSVADTAQMIGEFFGARVRFVKDRKEGETLPFMDTTKIKEASRENHLTPLPTALQEYLHELQA